jgi:hypothetical protein
VVSPTGIAGAAVTIVRAARMSRIRTNKRVRTIAVVVMDAVVLPPILVATSRHPRLLPRAR